MTKLLDWVLGREPVATATGLAAVVTALVGVLSAWDVWTPTPEQVAAIGTLITALAGWVGRSQVSPVAGPGQRHLDRVRRRVDDDVHAADAEAELDRSDTKGD